MKSIRKAVFMLFVCGTLSLTGGAKERGSRSKSIEAAGRHRFEPIVQTIEGWTVHVDPKLLKGQHSEIGTHALKMLANHLQRIAILVPNEQLTKLLTIEFWIEYAHPQLNGKQYHPNLKWLTDRGMIHVWPRKYTSRTPVNSCLVSKYSNIQPLFCMN